MARPELGIKRQCQNCGAKFYDLGHDPATCPKCGTVQQVVAAAVVARGRPEPARHAEAETKHRVEDALVVTAVAEEGEDAADVAVDEEEDIAAEGEESGDEDVFLEEDEEDEGGVSSLIDGDVEDEES
ncbi:MAG TPA: TIGR02300 family protein [Hyphomicrobiales bacterium]|nr:TIGR02300 family protein [Hyphomicrobiales bacterium]